MLSPDRPNALVFHQNEAKQIPEPFKKKYSHIITLSPKRKYIGQESHTYKSNINTDLKKRK